MALVDSSAESYGALARFSRAQYAALMRMRWAMFRNNLRSIRGAAELGARIFVGSLFSLVGVGIACGLGAAAFAMAQGNQWRFLPILFWAIFAVWQLLPITIASFQQQFEFGAILRFPVSFGAFYLLSFLFGLIDVSTLLGSLCCAGILLGITLAHPSLFFIAAFSLAVFALFNVLLSRMIFAWIERWLAQRRTREILTAVFLFAALSINFFNPALRGHPGGAWVSRQSRDALMHSLHTANQVQRWLPPGLAAQGLGAGAQAQLATGLESFALLGVCIFAAGGILGIRLRAEYRGENLGEAPSRKAERRTGRWLLDGSGPIAAVMEKELRTIFRAVNLLYGLGAPLVFVFIFAGLFKAGGPAASRIPWGFLLCLAYALLGFIQLIYNNLGTEGTGIQILFLSPTPIRTVILAKNLFHAVLFFIDAALVLILAGLRYGSPDPIAVSAAAAWALFALPVSLAAGNLLSVTMPYRINLGRIGRQKGSQANALLSMLIQIAVLGVGAGTIAACALWLHQLWIAIPIFLTLAVIAAIVWFQTLAPIERIFYRRRDDLLATLVRSE